MWPHTDAAVSRPIPPWHVATEQFCASLGQQVGFDALIVALWHVRQPLSDELLVVEGVDRRMMDNLLRDGIFRDPTLIEAQRHGVAVVDAARSPKVLMGEFRFRLFSMLPQRLDAHQWWSVAIGRQRRPFSAIEAQRTAQLVRLWQLAFDQVQSDHSRLLIGHDNRLIHSDAATSMRAIDSPGLLERLIEQFHPIVNQRWPMLGDREPHDFAIMINERSYCAGFHRARPGGLAGSEHWFVEIKPIGSDDLPTIGVLDDDRIAQAIGFMHDHYHEAPALAIIANRVHISPFHFHRLFCRHVGISPKQYLQLRQVQMSKWLLRDTHMPIATIAAATGFASHTHFTATFRRLVAKSPSGFREQDQQEP